MSVGHAETIKQIGDYLQGHIDYVMSVAVHNNKIISGKDKIIWVWNMETLKQIGEPLQDHTDAVRSVAVYNSKIVSKSCDNTIWV